MGKGEIARYEQFFLFPQCFQKGRQKESLCGNGLRKEVIRALANIATQTVDGAYQMTKFWLQSKGICCRQIKSVLVIVKT